MNVKIIITNEIVFYTAHLVAFRLDVCPILSLPIAIHIQSSFLIPTKFFCALPHISTPGLLAPYYFC